MSSIPNAQITHIGIYVRDLPVMTKFYCQVMGMVVSDGGPFGGRELAFLTRSSDEHHQLVMIHDPERPAAVSTLGQISFRLADLESLRQYYALLSELAVDGLEGRNHGNSWSLYMFDPEGNKIEIYVPTPWQVSQPWRAPLDLTKPADAIVEETRVLMQTAPGAQSAESWGRAMEAKLGQPSKVQEGVL
jgi:catechol 2,3-dioxygenase